MLKLSISLNINTILNLKYKTQNTYYEYDLNGSVTGY